MSLMYNSKNDTILTLDQLHNVPLPKALGARHRPYPFGHFVEQVKESLAIEGIEVDHEEYAVQKDNMRFFGMMQIQPKPLEGEYISAKDFALTLGLRGSHDQRIPRGLALGSQVMVCSNLCFSGNLGVFKTKQTTNIGYRLPSLIRDAVALIPQQSERQQIMFDTYKQYDMKRSWGDAALANMVRIGALSSSQFGTALHEWDKPSYNEHAEHGEEDGFTAWRLLNATTQALKPSGDTANMNTVQERSIKVTNFINEIVGFDY